MSTEREADRPQKRISERADLGQQYREIGISAVAAALPYAGAQKGRAFSPSEPKIVTIRDLELLFG